MFFGLLFPLLFELSVLIPDPAFSQGLLDAFISAYLSSFSVRTLMLVVVIFHSNSTQNLDISPMFPEFQLLYFHLTSGDARWMIFRNLFQQFAL